MGIQYLVRYKQDHTMRTEKKILISIVNLCLAATLFAAPAPQNSQSFGKGKAEITKFHVDTQIQFRYAVTNIETQIRNRHDEVKEVFFDMFIPQEAFVSNFSMVIKGKTYEAKVETKEVAEQTYEKSTSTSGLVKSNSLPEFTDGKQVTFSAKLDPTEKATFHPRYEEQVKRSEKGKYNYEVNIQPENQKIPDFQIKVELNESLPIEGLSVKRVKDKNVAKFQAEDITKEALKNLDKNVATIELTPNDAKNNGKDWKFVVNYDVKRSASGNDVQIGAGKFVHYFAPDNLPTMKKHVIFVIDVSGSMGGRKLAQTKDAMTTMLTKMSENNLDNFNIILFDDEIEVWKPEGEKSLSYSIPNSNGDVSKAYDFVLDLKDGGNTDINAALLKAIEIAKEVKKLEEIDSKTEQLIIFLTDGEPTAGVTSSSSIKKNVREVNADLQIPIYGLALGDGADFDLVKGLSDENNGFAERIYESGNSFEQLEDFYNKISDPKLKDVTFEYLVNGERIEPEFLTSTSIDKVFGSAEYSITGTLPKYEEINEIEVKINAQTDLGPFEDLFVLTPCLRDHPRSFPDNEDHEIIDTGRCFPYIPIPQFEWKQTPTEKFMERLWAFKRINYLLNDQVECTKGIDEFADNEELPETTTDSIETQGIDSESNENKCKEEVIRLALKYNFVTDVTSMVVEEEDEYISKGTVSVSKEIVYGNDDQDYYYDSGNSFFGHSTAHSSGAFSRTSSFLANSFVVSRSDDYSDDYYDIRSLDGRSDSIYTATTRPTTSTTLSTTTTSPSICKMTMFDQTYFRGKSVEITGDTSDFNDIDFDNAIASVIIEGNCCWALLTDSNYRGELEILNPGKYQSGNDFKEVFKKASSARNKCSLSKF